MTRHRAFVLLFALVALFLMVGFSVLFARFAMHALRAERLALLNAQSELLLESAAVWLEHARDTLRPAERISLPLDGCLPSHIRGTLEILRCAEGDAREYETVLRLMLGGRSVSRFERWRALPDGRMKLVRR